MTNFFKIFIFTVLFLALGISLGNIFDLTKNNNNLKTDIEILMEQVAEYENNLTITQAELIIAKEERQELVTTVTNYKNEVSELKSQAIIDTEKLAAAEANLATAQQALAEKEANILTLESKVDEYSLICSLPSASGTPKITGTHFDTTYEDFGQFSLIENFEYNDGWVNIALGRSLPRLYTSVITSSSPVKASTFFNSSTGLVALCRTFADLGFKYCSFYMHIRYGDNYGLGATVQDSQTLFNVNEFLAGVDNGTITNSNWLLHNEGLSGISHDKITSYSSVSIESFSFGGTYLRSESEKFANLTTVTVDTTEYTLTSNSVSVAGSIYLDSKLNIDKLFTSSSSLVVIDTNFDSFAYLSSNASKFLTDENSNLFSFTENAHIKTFYVTNDVNIDLIVDEIKSHVDTFVVLPFSAAQISYLIR